MTGARLVTRSVRLSVYNFFNEKYYSNQTTEQIIKMLTKLSGLNVHRGGLLGKKLYAYFNDVDSANAAALALLHVTYCATKVRRGTFDVTNLVRGNNTATLKDLRLQAQVSKTRLAKETKSVINTKKSSKTEQLYKDVKNNRYH